MGTDRCDCPLVSTLFPFFFSFAGTVIPGDMQIISTLNVRSSEGIIFQKVLPLGKCQSNANLQVHSSHQVHARATRFTSGNAERPIRQGKKIFPFKETFEIEFHFHKEKDTNLKSASSLDFRNLSRYNIRPLNESSDLPGMWKLNLNDNILTLECTNKSSFG
jgi:hypothetical protein